MASEATTTTSTSASAFEAKGNAKELSETADRFQSMCDRSHLLLSSKGRIGLTRMLWLLLLYCLPCTSALYVNPTSTLTAASLWPTTTSNSEIYQASLTNQHRQTTTSTSTLYTTITLTVAYNSNLTSLPIPTSIANQCSVLNQTSIANLTSVGCQSPSSTTATHSTLRTSIIPVQISPPVESTATKILPQQVGGGWKILRLVTLSILYLASINKRS